MHHRGTEDTEKTKEKGATEAQRKRKTILLCVLCVSVVRILDSEEKEKCI